MRRKSFQNWKTCWFWTLGCNFRISGRGRCHSIERDERKFLTFGSLFDTLIWRLQVGPKLSFWIMHFQGKTVIVSICTESAIIHCCDRKQKMFKGCCTYIAVRKNIWTDDLRTLLSRMEPTQLFSIIPNLKNMGRKYTPYFILCGISFAFKSQIPTDGTAVRPCLLWVMATTSCITIKDQSWSPVNSVCLWLRVPGLETYEYTLCKHLLY